MEISAGIQASLAGRYAVALFELAAEDGVVSAVESDLETLSAALAESSELASLITNPQLGRTAKAGAIEQAAKEERASAPALSDSQKAVLDAVSDLDPDNMTPREALDALYRLQSLKG